MDTPTPKSKQADNRTKVEWKSSATRELQGIDIQVIPKIIKAVDMLIQNPFPPQSRKLSGVESSYRLRVGDYRVIYQVDASEKTIIIFRVRHRKEAYRG